MSGWFLDPDSPFYDEFSDIDTGQWWIHTPKGLIGCSAEADARLIIALLGERDQLRARVALLEEFWLSIDAQESGVAEGPASEGRNPLPAEADDATPET